MFLIFTALWWIAQSAVMLTAETHASVILFLIAQALIGYAYFAFKTFANRSLTFKWTIACVASVYLLVQGLSIVYRMLRGFPLDFYFLADNRRQIFPTLSVIIGYEFILLSAAALGAFFLLFAWLLAKAPSKTRFFANEKRLCIVIMILAAWGYFHPWSLLNAAVPNVLFYESVTALSQNNQKPADVILPDFKRVYSDRGESVFIVQLESGNALALNGKPAGGNYMPYMTKASKDGVFMPFMWGASVQTHRAQGAILCGAVMDMGEGIIFKDPAPTKCLPALLAEDGYRTVYQSACWDVYNIDKFMRATGFKDVQSGTMMKDSDRRYRWAYDDCRFYDRAFDYLEKSYGKSLHERMFAYFEVSAHHFPFYPHAGYEAQWPFADASTPLQSYLDSYAMQDYCLTRFLKRMEPYRDNTHVFILADHSFPVSSSVIAGNEIGAGGENFLIPFLYLPPKNNARAYRNHQIHTPIAGQADLLATILELVSGTYYPNSFAFLLEQTPSNAAQASAYEDCQIAAQPHDGGKVAVIKGKTKYTYHFLTREMLITHLRPDLTEAGPLERAKEMSFDNFRKNYFCQRYR